MAHTKWPLPELGSRVPPEAIAIEHADFKANKGDWKFFRESDELTGGYAASNQTYTGPDTVPSFKETYLIPHIKEADPEQFARRVAASRPPRFVKEGIESITGVLTQTEPNRDTYPPKLSKWTSGVTIDGATLQQWISTELWPMVERYGLCYSLARRPSIAAANLAEQAQAIEDAGLPEVLLHVIIPENVPWWAVDDIGQYEIIRYTEQKTRSTLVDSYAVLDEEYTRHWWITAEGWWYTDDLSTTTQANVTLKVEAVGTWNAGGAAMQHFPIAKWSLKDDTGPTKTAAYAQLMYFRKDSELHTVEVSSAFSMTWIPTSAASDDPEETVQGPHQIGGWDPESSGGAKPMILETSGVSMQHFIEKRLPQLEADASAPYGINDSVSGNDSGVALAHIEQKAKSIYVEHAQAGGMSEFAALQPVAELLNEELKDEQRAVWNTSFGTLSDSSMAEILRAFAEMEPGELFEIEILKKFASMVGGMTAKQVEAALAVWTADRKEKELQLKAQEEAILNGGLDDIDETGEPRREQPDSPISKPFAQNPQSAAGPAKER